MKSQIPPLNAVRFFEAASRHLSFVRAAEELGVTQSAVSKQIATLEDYIGSQLFERKGGGVALTLEGRELKQAVGPAFELLQSSFQRYTRRSRYDGTIRLTTVASFASQFLMPRLSDFQLRFPSVKLEILTSDRLVDLVREAVDLSIRFGTGNWPDVSTTPLTTGRLIPICSPQVFDDHEQLAQRVLASMPRIQTSLLDEWRAFDDVRGQGAEVNTNGLMLEHFLVALQAVRVGQGVALLPEILIRDELQADRLIALSEPVDWTSTFYLCHMPGVDQEPKLRDFVTWLLEESAAG